jgi:hypothetical protein
MTTDHFNQPTETKPVSDKGITSLTMDRTNIMTMSRRNSEASSSNKSDYPNAGCLLQDILSQYNQVECAGVENISVQIIEESMNMMDSVFRATKTIS